MTPEEKLLYDLMRTYPRLDTSFSAEARALWWRGYNQLLQVALRQSAVSNVLREALAEYAHSAWSDWMRYMFSKCDVDLDGGNHIPSPLVQRWQRQMNTPYAELPENEKESDRAEADKILAALEQAG